MSEAVATNNPFVIRRRRVIVEMNTTVEKSPLKIDEVSEPSRKEVANRRAQEKRAAREAIHQAERALRPITVANLINIVTKSFVTVVYHHPPSRKNMTSSRLKRKLKKNFQFLEWCVPGAIHRLEVIGRYAELNRAMSQCKKQVRKGAVNMFILGHADMTKEHAHLTADD